MENRVKFALIALCFLFSLSYGRRCVSQRDGLLLRIAMFFTVLADYCLLIVFESEWGVGFFCAVQCAYAFRYGGRAARLPLALAPAVYAAARFAARASLLHALCAGYAFLFCVSLFFVFRAYKQKTMPFANRLLSVCGMVLFAACDVNVALLGSGLPIASVLARGIFFLIWLFYLPSQLLLALSARSFETSQGRLFIRNVR